MNKKFGLIIIFIAVATLLCSCTNNTPTITINEESTLTFYEGEFNISKIKIDVKNSNNQINTVTVTESMLSVSISNFNKLGSYPVTITYQKATCNTTITIKEKEIIEISLNNDSITTFNVDNVNISDIYINVKYFDNTVDVLPLKEEYIKTDLNTLNEAGIYDLIINYKNFELIVKITIQDLSNFTFEKINGGYTLTGYNGNLTDITIPSTYNNLPVIEISEQAFFNNHDIIRVTIPNTITKIGEAAFYKMNNLSSIIIPRSVETIDKYGVYSAKIIYLESTNKYTSDWYDTLHSYIQEEVDINSIVKDGDYEYFIKNDKLVLSNYFGSDSVITTPTSFNDKIVEIIGGACFKGNTNITSLTISDGVTEIEKYGLAELENLVNLKLSNTIETLGEYSLRGCTLLEHINLPTSLKTIEYGTFNMCSNLQEMIIPDTVTYIGGYAFAWCVKINKIYIPQSVTEIKAGACYSCSSATIYCETEKEPSTWETGWNMSNRKIIWNYTEE